MGRDKKNDELPPIARALDHLIRTHKDKDGNSVSIEDVAAAINSKGFSAAYLYALRAGTKRNPTVSTLQTLADFFGVHVGFFFGGPAVTAPSANAPAAGGAPQEQAGAGAPATSQPAAPQPTGERGSSGPTGLLPSSRPAPQDDAGSSDAPAAEAEQSPDALGPGPSAAGVPAGVDLAARLEHLFNLRLRPDGAPWSMRQVSAAAKKLGVSLSVGFLHDLRRGIKDNPTKQQLECLAEIFGVRPGYFFDDDDTLAAVNEKLRTLGALEDDRVASIALRTRNLSARDFRILSAMIDSAIGEYGKESPGGD